MNILVWFFGLLLAWAGAIVGTILTGLGATLVFFVFIVSLFAISIGVSRKSSYEIQIAAGMYICGSGVFVFFMAIAEIIQILSIHSQMFLR